MKFNKNELHKLKERKIMKKVKKNWVVTSISFFSLIGVGMILNGGTNVSADTTVNVVQKSTSSASTDSSSSDKASSASTNSSSSDKASSASTDPSSSDKASSASTNSSSSDKASSASTNSSSSDKASSASTDSSSSDKASSASTDPSSSDKASSASTNSSSSDKASSASTDSSSSDDSNVKNIDDFIKLLLVGGNYGAHPDPIPSWVDQIDTIGAKYKPQIEQIQQNGDYFVIPEANIEKSEQLFNDFLNDKNVSNDYRLYSNYYGVLDAINGRYFSGNIGDGSINSNYEPTDTLKLDYLDAQTTFGNTQDNYPNGYYNDNTGNTLNGNNQILKPYAGIYQAPIYSLDFQDVTSPITNDNGDQLDVDIPLDYMIYLHPQVQDKNGNIVTNDLTSSPIINVNYYLSNDGTTKGSLVGSQQIAASVNGGINNYLLTPPNSYAVINDNGEVTTSSSDVLVSYISSSANDNSKASAASSAASYNSSVASSASSVGNSSLASSATIAASSETNDASILYNIAYNNSLASSVAESEALASSANESSVVNSIIASSNNSLNYNNANNQVNNNFDNEGIFSALNKIPDKLVEFSMDLIKNSFSGIGKGISSDIGNTNIVSDSKLGAFLDNAIPFLGNFSIESLIEYRNMEIKADYFTLKEFSKMSKTAALDFLSTIISDRISNEFAKSNKELNDFIGSLSSIGFFVTKNKINSNLHGFSGDKEADDDLDDAKTFFKEYVADHLANWAYKAYANSEHINSDMGLAIAESWDRNDGNYDGYVKIRNL